MEYNNKVLTDPLAFVIQECTFILSAMRKNNRSSNSPFTSLLLNQFLSDSTTNIPSYPEIQNSNNNKSNKFKDEDPFLSGFVELRLILSDIDNLNSINLFTLLQPFLVVIKSPSTSCYITDLAVSSLIKFFKYEIINESQENIVQAISQIISTLAHCRFEGSDQTQDDLLLIKIINLLQNLVESNLGNILTDDSMYEIISTCFSLAINTRRRDMLRSAAENSLLSITEIVFSKLKLLESKPEIDHNTKSAQLEFNNDGSLPKDTIGGSISTPIPESSNGSFDNIKATLITDDDTKSINIIEKNIETNIINDSENYDESIEDKVIDTSISLEIPDKDINFTPYGVACMREFLNHTVEILLPENRFRFTESTRALSLEILIKIVEISGYHITKHNQLFSFISDDCCHHIVQIIQNSDSSILITLALKLILYFAINFPNHLKIQLELIFTTIFQSIINDDSLILKDLDKFDDLVFEMTKKGKFETNLLHSENEINDLKKEFDTGKSHKLKEFFLESLSVLWCRSPYLFINLFKAYDCDFDRSDLTTSLINLLCRLSYSDCSILITNNVPSICLEGLVFFVNGIYNRIKKSNNLNEKYDNNTIHPLIKQYMKKSDFIECVKQWNNKPDKGLELLKEKGFINDINDDKEVAKFLFTNSGRIDKKKLGELLAKPAKSNLLKEFVSLLDFKNLRPDESLRLLLNYFRLPGEAQQIDRIVSTFNERYIECQDAIEEINEDSNKSDEDNKEETEKSDEEEKVMPDSDAMYVLSFSIIMLNTDLHNPNVKKPMSLEDYQKNLRGCYKGKNFPFWYTEKMYNSIKEKEIIMPEEHKGTAKWFETEWGSLVAEQDTKKFEDCEDLWTISNNFSNNDLLQFDKLLFEKNFRHLISAFVVMFNDATHDSIITKMMSIIEKCSAIAIFFDLDDSVDRLIEILSHLSTLTGVKKSEYLVENAEYLPIIEMKSKDSDDDIFISDLAVLMGRDYRAQLSVIVFNRILKRDNYKVTKGWYYVIKSILSLFENGLIDPNIFTEFQNKLKFDKLKKPNGEYKIDKSDSSKDNGIFSTFSSYLKGLSDDTPEPTEEEIDTTLTCIEFINSSGLNDLIINVSKTKDHENMNKLVQILLALLPHKTEKNERFFIEETLLLLEIMVCYLLITKNHKLITQLCNKCDSILNETKDIKMSTITRILSYKLLIIQAGNETDIDKLNSTIEKIHSLTTTNKESFIKHGINLLGSLEQLAINEDSWCFENIVSNKEYWSILRVFASSPKITENVYQFILNIYEEHSSLIEYKNYMDILGLLDEISAVGAYGAQWEHEFDKLIDSGLKVDSDNNKNPYQELVNVASESITLTSKFSSVIENDKFINSIKEAETDTKEMIISPWYPLIEAISHQCYNPCRQLRNHALKTLQNLLISNEHIPVEKLSLNKIIDASCLRLLVELIKPEVSGTDVRGMIKTQKDVLALSCKIILNYDFKEDIQSVTEKVFAISSQMLQKNKVAYPNSGNEDEIIEILRNLLMIKKDDLDLIKLKGYKMDGDLKKLIEEVSQEKVHEVDNTN